MQKPYITAHQIESLYKSTCLLFSIVLDSGFTKLRVRRRHFFFLQTTLDLGFAPSKEGPEILFPWFQLSDGSCGNIRRLWGDVQHMQLWRF